MAMLLANVSEVIIQRVGRWISNAFLEYIREQMSNFTYGVSTKMLQNEHFQTIHASRTDSTTLEDIFIPPQPNNKSDGLVPVTIDHPITFSSTALGVPAPRH